MKFDSPFELAGALARIHSKDLDLDDPQVHFVPVVVNDLSRALPALQALCSIGDGVLLDAINDPTLDAPVLSTRDPVRRAAVEAELMTTTSGGSIDVKYVDVGSDRIDAHIAGRPTGAVLSAGESMTLAVARAIMHADLDQRALAVIVYTDGPLDIFLARALWRVGANQLAKLRSSVLKTLVFVAESQIDIVRHCGARGGFRFALEGERILRRNLPDALSSDVQQIANHPAAVALFLGAGFAASSQLPVGNLLRDEAISRLLGIPFAADPDTEDLCRRFHAFAEDKSNLLLDSERGMNAKQFQEELTLEQVVYAERLYGQEYSTLEKFKEIHDKRIATPGAAVIDLARAVGARPEHFVIVEVNFDLLIESHLKVPYKVFATEAQFEEAADYVKRFLEGRETAVPVLKLHGTIIDFESCVIQVDQTGTGMGPAKRTALEALISDPGRLFVYVGASMRDKDLTPFLLGEECADGLDERWVSPYLVETIERFAESRQRKWRATDRPTLQDRVITETADTFFAKLAEVMTA